jgi:hypothetical protein
MPREEITERIEPCESHDCQHKDKPIVTWRDARGDMRANQFGLVWSPTGVRHHGCPDPHLARFLEQSGREQVADLDLELEKAGEAAK